MRGVRRTLAIAAVILSLSSGAQAYYHFVRYLSRSAPWNPVVEKFDLNALQNKTVPFLIAEQGPSQMVSGDNFNGLVSQVRLAAKVWNDVESSDLRLVFGGFFSPGVQHSSPAIEVIFDEVPPGLLAYGGPTSKADPTTGLGGQFVPVLKSTMVLPRNLEQASWAEGLYLTIVHELGHCLGLQHTLTSGAMSTSITRATTKGRPLSADDVAGVSLLYPARNLAAISGTIAGRVTLGGGGNGALNLASVVAVSLNGTAVSALTQPDGTYKIEGVPPGQYYVYAHPLPPAVGGETYPANVTPPRDADGRFINATAFFQTQFYPGTSDPVRAEALPIDPGSNHDNINFSVTRRSAPAVYGVQTFSFPAQVAVKPAHLTTGGSRSFIVASGYGLSDRAAVGVLGGSVAIPQGGVKPYQSDPRFLQMDFQFNLASGEGSRHLTFSFDNDLYVLPAAFRITRTPPPSVATAIASLDGSGQRIVIVTGSGFSAETQILFNGIPATVRSSDAGGSALTVLPPPGVPGERAYVVAVNPDGQSSLFLQSVPVAYEFESSDAWNASVATAVLPAGAEGVVEITGANAGFSSSYATLSFGSAAIQVRRVWVTGPNRILANVAVAPGAPSGPVNVTLLNGLRSLTLPGAFQVVAGNGRTSVFRGPVTDPNTGRRDIPAGGLASVRLVGSLADVPASSLNITVADRPGQVVSNSGGQLTFRVPGGLQPGAAIVRLTSGSDSAVPIAMSIDLPPPAVAGVFISGARVDANRPARPGELLLVTVNGLADAGVEVPTALVQVQVGNVTHAAAAVSVSGSGHQVQFVLDTQTPGGTLPLSVNVDGRQGSALPIPVIKGN